MALYSSKTVVLILSNKTTNGYLFLDVYGELEVDDYVVRKNVQVWKVKFPDKQIYKTIKGWKNVNIGLGALIPLAHDIPYVVNWPNCIFFFNSGID